MATPRIIKRVEKELSQTKIILRHLPPDMTKETLLETFNPLPPHSAFYFVPGGSAHMYSRAYFNFESDSESLRSFRDSYDGYQLEGTGGKHYRMIVEFAPYQGVGRPKAKTDTRCGTIYDDPDYTSFLEQYESIQAEPSQKSVDLSYLDSLDRTLEVQPTPLSEFLKERKFSRRDRGGRKVTYIVKEKKKKPPKVIEVKMKEGGKKKASSASAEGGGAADSKEGVPSKPKEKKVNEKKEKPVIIVHEKVNGKEKGKGKALPTSGGAVRNKDRQDQQLYSPKVRRGGGGGGASDRGSDHQSRSNDEKRKSPSSFRNDSHHSHSSYGGKHKSGGGGAYRNSRHDNNHQYQFLEDKDDYQGPDFGGGAWSSRGEDRGGRYHGNKRTYDHEYRGNRSSSSHYK